MERSEKKGGEVPQFTFMATLLTPCSVLSIKCLQRRRALRCVLTARVNASHALMLTHVNASRRSHLTVQSSPNPSATSPKKSGYI